MKIFNPEKAFNTSFERKKVKVLHGISEHPKEVVKYLLSEFDFLTGKEPKKESE